MLLWNVIEVVGAWAHVKGVLVAVELVYAVYDGYLECMVCICICCACQARAMDEPESGGGLGGGIAL